MHAPDKLRDLARKSLERANLATDPAAVEQLRRWAIELADAADAAEWNVNDPGDPDIARMLFEN
jgi:hypothetical protein